jgi:hypothetical protein
MPLGDFLEQRYDEAHSLKRYCLPALVFYITYLFGLYWFCVAVGYLFGLENTISTTGDSKNLTLVAVGATGFMGSATVVIWHLFWRTMRADMQPRAFTHFAARLVIAPILAILVTKGVLYSIENVNMMLFSAFTCGMLIEPTFRFIERRGLARLLGKSRILEAELPLRNLQGLTQNDELRLWEEGIADCEHLAVETVERLLVFTNYSLERIIDWKDQAFLYIYVRDELSDWRRLQNRGAMDILGLAPHYYGKQKHDQMCEALAKELKKDKAVIARFIDTVYNDPRVHQLWKYLNDVYPADLAQPITPESIRDHESHAKSD